MVIEETNSEKVRVAVCAVGVELSVTVTVKEKFPAAVGVPLKTPAEESVTPAGSAPPVTAHVYGVFPPVAASDCE